jgi:DNA-binding MarR family transcriptional regulator
MTKVDPSMVWALHYRVTMSVMAAIAPAIRALRLEVKELFLLATVDEHPHPADLAAQLLMPKPTVTVLVKRLEAAGYLKRGFDATDLRRHRLTLTTSGRRAMTRGLAILSDAYGARLDRLTRSQQQDLLTIFERLSAPIDG